MIYVHLFRRRKERLALNNFFEFMRAALPWIAMGLLLAVFIVRSARGKKNADKKEDLFIVLNALNRMLIESGFLERYFRPEGKYNDHVVALPIEKTNIRLYCLRMSDSVLIVGNGGIKKGQTYQEDDNLNGYVIALQQLDKLLKKEIIKGKVRIEKTKITGIDNTLFEI